jgi:hypothetical protein
MTERAGAGVQREEALSVFFETTGTPCARVETWGKTSGFSNIGPGSRHKDARLAHGA